MARTRPAVISRSRRREKRRPAGEAGAALAVAVGVSFVVVLLSMAAVTQSMSAINHSSIANTEVQSVDAAEAGIGFELAALTSNQSTFNCPASPTLSNGVTYTLTYSIQTGGTPPPRTTVPTQSCATSPSQSLSSSKPSYIVVRSVGRSQYAGFGNRTVEALIVVASGTDGSLPDAVHGESGVHFQNQGSISAASGVANIYAGDGSQGLPCASSGGTVNVTGSIYSAATGSWDLSNGCSIGGDVWGAGPITISSSSPSIAGTVRTPSTITVNNPPSRAFGAADAGGVITVPNGGQPSPVPPNLCPATIFSTCHGTDASVVAPPSNPLPVITAANYPTPPWTVTTVPTCSQAAQSIITAARVGSGQQAVVLPGGCTWAPNGGTLTISNDLAVIVPAGISASNQFSLLSTGGAHSVSLVVPNGSSGDIRFDGPTFDPSLSVLLYTPGSVTFSNFNSTGLHGAVYAGRAVSSNAGLNLVYVPVIVSGLGGGGGGGSNGATQSWEYSSP